MNHRVGSRPDYGFLGLLAAVVLVGLVMLTSASGPAGFQKFQDSYWFLKHQLLFGLLPGLFLFWVFWRIDYRYWRGLAPQLLLVSVILLLIVFIPGIGAEWGTSRSWVHIGGFSFQPAEIVKLTFLLYVAAWMEHRGETVVGSTEGIMPFFGAVGVIALLMMLQPDLGSLLVIGSIAFTAYFVAGANWSHIAALAAVGAAGLFVIVKSAPYRAARLMTFLHPELDPLGRGYHINQAYLAIGSGGLFGLGLGHSRQKYAALPEVVGDSVFAVMAEELGLILTLAVLALFCALLWKCLEISRRAPDPFGRFIAAGIAGWIFSQTMFNIGSMVGILPITGLPMPFVSYGGTALAVLLGAMGLMANVSSHMVSSPERTLSR
jgi:cell division protein FtsW